jgi:hypothetical protein
VDVLACALGEDGVTGAEGDDAAEGEGVADGEGDGDRVGDGEGDLDGVALSLGETSVGDVVGETGCVGVSPPLPGLLGDTPMLIPALDARDLIASPAFPEHAANTTAVLATSPSAPSLRQTPRDIRPSLSKARRYGGTGSSSII